MYEAKLLENGTGKVVDAKGNVVATTYAIDGKNGHETAKKIAAALNGK